jgi:hypothetical protein
MPKIGAFAVSTKVCSSFAIRVISSSACLRSVMSCPTPSTQTTWPTTSRRVVALNSTSTRFFSLVYRGNSKLAASRPCSALSITSFTGARSSAVMKSLTRSLPITSALVKQVISAAFIDTSNTPIFGIDAKGCANEWNNKVCSSLATRVFSCSTWLCSVISCPIHPYHPPRHVPPRSCVRKHVNAFQIFDIQ